MIRRKVSALFVTMNRAATAVTCLEHLSAQTYLPSGVFIINNASTDDTFEKLEEFSKTNPGYELQVIHLDSNLGNAGGMEIGFTKAFESGADAVWILDDDSWPEPRALEELLKAPNLPEPCVRTCHVIDLESGRLSWPLQIESGTNWRTLQDDDQVPDQSAVKIRRSWLGALIPKEIFNQLGNIEGSLFLRGEDEDYPRRIEKAGFETFLIPTSVLHHPLGGKLRKIHVLGRDVVLEDGLQGRKLYYRLRNSWWLTRRDHGLFKMVILSLAHLVLLARFYDRATNWGSAWLSAFHDAFKGNLGR